MIVLISCIAWCCILWTAVPSKVRPILVLLLVYGLVSAILEMGVPGWLVGFLMAVAGIFLLILANEQGR